MLDSQTFSTIEYVLNKIKNRYSINILEDCFKLYPYFTDACPREDLIFIENHINLKDVFSSAYLSDLVRSLPTSNDKNKLINDTASNLISKLKLDKSDALEFACLFARVATGSSAFNAGSISSSSSSGYNSSSYSRASSNIQTPSDFVLVQKDIMNVVKVNDFYICKHQVTQEEYEKVMGSNPSYFKGYNLPVERVSWFDAIDYCIKRSEKEGREPVYTLYRGNCIQDLSKNGYRLLSSLEWEWAASGGVKAREIHKYSGSNNIDEVAWYSENSDNKTHPVMQKRPNELGIYDMTGNVWEWCWDTRKGAVVWNENKKQHEWSDNAIGRVYRGGGWRGYAERCEVSVVNSDVPSFVIDGLGFRVALSFS